MKKGLLTILTLLSGSAYAVPVAIVDSGTDLNHPELRDIKWVNTKDEDDAVDNDDNGYIDDTHGWNFAENDNKLFDKRLIGKFSPDVYRYFEIQKKMLNGAATQEEIAWVKGRLKDPEYLRSLQTFGNFVHGSHVAGIAAAGATGVEIMPLKLIPTRAPKIAKLLERQGTIAQAQMARNDELRKKLVRTGIEFLAKNQAGVFQPISLYLKNQGARVANCSFGTSHAVAKKMLEPLLQMVFRRKMTEEELNEYAAFFVNSIAKASADAFVAPAQNTLFVMAAGNDGMDNDAFPTSPANIKAHNTITVAATNGGKTLATFSNYGAKLVDIAAPGVGIRSAIPGGEYIELSGTSQAAPFVAGVAGQILALNPALSPAEVKLILMGTVDKKAFLKGKVLSGGMANSARALFAARLTQSVSIAEAIQRSTREIRDLAWDGGVEAAAEAFALPMLSFYR